jgi:hypothetical protein
MNRGSRSDNRMSFGHRSPLMLMRWLHLQSEQPRMPMSRMSAKVIFCWAVPIARDGKLLALGRSGRTMLSRGGRVDTTSCARAALKIPKCGPEEVPPEARWEGGRVVKTPFGVPLQSSFDFCQIAITAR